MNSRITFALCIIAMFLLAVALPMATAEQNGRFQSKLSNPGWLSAPHFPAFEKRGRFVFRDLANAHHQSENDEAAVNPDKRNWRL